MTLENYQELTMQLKETCAKCQVPHAQEEVILETKPIDDTEFRLPALEIPPIEAVFPGFNTQYGFSMEPE